MVGRKEDIYRKGNSGRKTKLSQLSPHVQNENRGELSGGGWDQEEERGRLGRVPKYNPT